MRVINIDIKILKNVAIISILIVLVACGKNNYDNLIDSAMEVFKEDLSESTLGVSVLNSYESDYELKNESEIVIWEDDGYIKISVPATENYDVSRYYKIDNMNLESVSDDEIVDLGEPNYHEKEGEIIKE